MIWLLPYPLPSAGFSLSQSSCVSPVELIDGREGDRVGKEPNDTTARNLLSFNTSYSSLACYYSAACSSLSAKLLPAWYLAVSLLPAYLHACFMPAFLPQCQHFMPLPWYISGETAETNLPTHYLNLKFSRL
jgi:hypothetical protein